MNTDKLIHADLSSAIIGAAMKVLNTLKPGLSEKAYENALVLEPRKQGLKVDQQKRFDVRYDGELSDTLVPDMLVNDLVIVDPKVVETFSPTHEAQRQGYLHLTNLRLALLINFKFVDLRWKRVVK